MRITIHQPEHMPWLGFFHKVAQVDICVILDNVQFSKNYFQNRNKVRTGNQWAWITVPVNHNISTLIKDVTIASDPRWKKKWWNTVLYSYQKTDYANLYLDQLYLELYRERDNLSDLNVALIKLLSKFLGLKTGFILASEMDKFGKGSELILDICKKVGAKTYLSGISGKEYLELKDFYQAGIEVEFQEFYHPVYHQRYEPFIPCMSVIDLLCSQGEGSLDIINGMGVQVMGELFL